jgi:quercetin dioxygenase-like cupin family protein
MELNVDFSIPARQDLATMPWQDSPQPGVSRRMLDRVGDEVARATTVVLFEPGASFPHHVHDLGEEFLILSGTFQDKFALRASHEFGSYGWT